MHTLVILYRRLLGLLLLAFVLQLVAGCAATQPLPALAPTRADTLLSAAGLKSVGKLVVRGNVTIQTGTGNTSSVGSKAKTKAQALSTGDNSPVTASEKKGGLPWWVFLLVAVGGAIGWEYLSHQLKPLGWLKWRAPVAT